MENAEEVLQILERFTRLKQKEIPKELDEYLQYVAKTGDTLFGWTNLKYLFREKLLYVIKTFYEATSRGGDGEIPQYPNVDPFNYENMKSALLERLELFNAAPFTIQRLCELLIDPRKQYSRIDKFMRALEKNILVVSTIDPGRRIADSENGDSLDSAVNGDISDVNVDVDLDNEMPFNAETTVNGVVSELSTVGNDKTNDMPEKGNGTRAAVDDGLGPNPKKAKLDVRVVETEKVKQQEVESIAEEKKIVSAESDSAAAKETADETAEEEVKQEMEIIIKKLEDTVDVDKTAVEIAVAAAIETKVDVQTAEVLENGKQSEKEQQQQQADDVEMKENLEATKETDVNSVVAEIEKDVTTATATATATATDAVDAADETVVKATAAADIAVETESPITNEKEPPKLATKDEKEPCDAKATDSTVATAESADTMETADDTAEVSSTTAVVAVAEEVQKTEQVDDKQESVEEAAVVASPIAVLSNDATEQRAETAELTTAAAVKNEEAVEEKKTNEEDNLPVAEAKQAAEEASVETVTAATVEETPIIKEKTEEAAAVTVAVAAVEQQSSEQTNTEAAEIVAKVELDNVKIAECAVTGAADAAGTVEIVEKVVDAATPSSPAALQEQIEEDVPLNVVTESPIAEELPVATATVAEATATTIVPNLALNDQPMEEMTIEETATAAIIAVPPTAATAIDDEVIMAEETAGGGSIEMATDAMETATSKDEPAGMEVDDTSQEAMDQ